jgi:hypothetical protein
VTTTTYEAELASNNPNNVFKALGGIIYQAPIATAIPAAFTTGATSDLAIIPAAWKKLGLLTKGDGVTFPRDIGTEEEEAWGYREPIRTDITQDVSSANFTLMEQQRYVLEMYDFVDLSAITPDATTGEWAYNKPQVTPLTYRRMLFLAVDGSGTARRYRIKIMPRAQVIGVNDEVWQQGASTKFPVQIRATVDPTLLYSVRNVFAGPGQKTLNAAALA